MEAGIRVVRGPDWKWGNQDGGEGSVGTVVAVDKPGSSSSPHKTVIVQWDSGTRTNYRCGYQAAFDLYVFDNGQIGVAHVNVSCSHCKEQGIKGIRWQCADCESYNLCTACYMGDKHHVQHNFYRIESPHSAGVFVGKRYGIEKIQARGMFPGARVSRGPDWDWGDQDGGSDKVGMVTGIKGWEQESYRSVVCVAWSTTVINVYRFGHKGKVDLRCVSARPGGYYYKDHLPKLGKTPESQSLQSSVHSNQFLVGDHVKVVLEEEVLKAMQTGHGGWNDKMKEVISLVGSVHRITENGDVRVQYPGSQNRWTFHPAAVTKVKGLQVSDKVIISDDAAAVRRAQAGHGEWADSMTAAIGKTGKIMKVYSDGDVSVAIGSRTWTFNPSVLTKQCSSLPQPVACTTSASSSTRTADSDNTGNMDQLRDANVRVTPPVLDSLDLNADVGSILVTAAGQGQWGKVRDILAANPNMTSGEVDSTDANLQTSLLLAADKLQLDIVCELLTHHACVNKHNDAGDTPLHIVVRNHALKLGSGKQPTSSEDSRACEVAQVLIQHGADASIHNKLNQTPSQLCHGVEMASVLSAGSQSAGSTPAVTVATTINCRLCEAAVDCKFMPCGHSVVCFECGHMFKKCFHCKVAVENVQKLECNVVQECMVCCDFPADVVFEPCTHKIVCTGCAVRMKKCIMCQAQITRKTGPGGAVLAPPEPEPTSYHDTMSSLVILQARVREMEDATQCAICLENPRNVAFLCGHGTCEVCCQSLDVCPLCRHPIEKKITLFS